MHALKVISKIDTGESIISLMAGDCGSRFIHINNYKTGKNSTITPLDSIRSAIKEAA